MAVNGPSQKEVQGFVIPMNTRQIQSVFKPTGGSKFGNPHDVSVSPDGNDIYVVEISQPYKVIDLNLLQVYMYNLTFT